MSIDVQQPFDAIVLAGGEGIRLEGADKAAVTVGGRPMLAHVLDAVAGARRTVVVAPPSVETFGVDRVQEVPPLGGPAAGMAAGLAHLGQDGGAAVVVLACDLPLAGGLVPELLAVLARDAGVDGAVVVDAGGRRQPLLAVYRAPALRSAVARLVASGGVSGASMRRLLEPMTLVEVPDPTGAAQDADTWDAVAELDSIIARRTT